VHYLLFALRAGGPDKAGSPLIKRFTLWERFVLAATMVCLAGLVVTGFAAAVCGQLISGYLLMLHMTFAPPFILGLLGLVVTWAHDCRFEAHDLQWALGMGCLRCGKDSPAGKFDVGQKGYFWLLAVLGVVLILSAAFSMVPLFGTNGQELLFEIHRYAGLVLLMATIVHMYNCTLARPGAWLSLLTGQVRLNWAKRYHSVWASKFMPEDLVEAKDRQ